MSKYISIECRECEGAGTIERPNRFCDSVTIEVSCPKCDGTGYIEILESEYAESLKLDREVDDR